MRSLKLASFFLLGSCMSFAACNGGSGDGDGDGDGVGATSGDGDGDVGDGDGDTPGTGGGTGDGDGDNTNPACTTTITATGTPAMIDNFDHGMSWNFPDDGDGRVGTWEHEYWDFTGATTDRLFSEPKCGDEAGCTSDGMGGASGNTPGYLVASCSGTGEELWCATAWDSENPWGQWASVSTRLTTYSATDVNCYNAGTFTGISFKAKSPTSDKILLQAADPSADPTQGWTFKSNVITLTDAWETYQVPFDQIVMPEWVGPLGGPTGAVDKSALISIAFVMRNVMDQGGGTGESLLPYEVHIDDVSFY